MPSKKHMNDAWPVQRIHANKVQSLESLSRCSTRSSQDKYSEMVLLLLWCASKNELKVYAERVDCICGVSTLGRTNLCYFII